jgi:hypothetical protein
VVPARITAINAFDKNAALPPYSMMPAFVNIAAVYTAGRGVNAGAADRERQQAGYLKR